MNALKALVIGMAILIVAGFVLLLWKIGDIATTDTVSASGPVSLQLPDGCRIVEVDIDDGVMAVRTSAATPLDGCGQVHMIDATSGAVIATITR